MLIRLFLSAVLLCALAVENVQAQSADAENFFETKIRPVLVEHCFECHSTKAESVEGGLLLDNRASMQKGGDNGPALKTKDPDNSLIIRALRYEGDLEMPPEGKLPDSVIADFEHWIRTGAYDPRGGAVITAADKIENSAKQHWAYQPIQPPAIPTLDGIWKAWARDDIDHLVAAKLSRKGIEPGREAERLAWLRRVTFDLTGLPPTFEEAEAFRNDTSSEAFARVVDRLLAAPQFGERWARHWLDVARYGDTKGYVFRESRDYPNAFKYRDWVINSLNNDLPIDEFLRLQIAADHFVDKEEKAPLAALGYITLGRRFLNNKHDIIDDRMDVIFRGMMGLTLSCARCHDHKYDPLSAKDYYGVYSVFASSKEQQDKELPLRLIDGAPRDGYVFLRGKPGNRGPRAPRRFPEFFELGADRFREGSGRKQLAEAVTDPKNPLTARVFVNRVWGKLFGEHLVTTPSDFGLRAEPPVQQDVLDTLANDLMHDGWSAKRLIRRLVLSSVYRQSSDWREDADQIDPENRLLWRTPRRRLDFEAMRDAMLIVSGRLDGRVGGESAKIATDANATRRTLYAFIDRQNLPDLFRTFDFALPDTHSPKRPYTTSPQQSLYLMNNAFAQLSAEELAKRIEGAGDDEQRVTEIHRLLFARDPTPFEREAAKRFLDGGERRPRWELGYGDWSEDKALTLNPFPRLDGETWKGKADFPDPELGYASLHARGGHPGVPGFAVARRWNSPRNGVVRLRGQLQHKQEKGNGVRARILRNGKESLQSWTAKSNQVATNVDSIEVKAGDSLELVVDCNGDISFDAFLWSAELQLNADGKIIKYNSADSLQTNELSLWARYAQTLMMTNEFLFLD